MQAAGQNTKDKHVETAIHHWAPRFVSSGVPLTDFEEVTAGISRWDQWCAAWSARAEIHEGIGRKVLEKAINSRPENTSIARQSATTSASSCSCTTSRK